MEKINIEDTLKDINLERTKSKRKIEWEIKVHDDLTNILAVASNLVSPVQKENLLTTISNLMYELRNLPERKDLRDSLHILYDEIEKKTF